MHSDTDNFVAIASIALEAEKQPLVPHATFFGRSTTATKALLRVVALFDRGDPREKQEKVQFPDISCNCTLRNLKISSLS